MFETDDCIVNTFVPFSPAFCCIELWNTILYRNVFRACIHGMLWIQEKTVLHTIVNIYTTGCDMCKMHTHTHTRGLYWQNQKQNVLLNAQRYVTLLSSHAGLRLFYLLHIAPFTGKLWSSDTNGLSSIFHYSRTHYYVDTHNEPLHCY